MYIGKMLCYLTLFSPVWVFYVLRLVASEVAYSHWLHLYDFSMLFDNMFPQIVWMRSATFPFKWFLFAVYEHMPCWITWFVRDIFTLITFMRFYPKRISLCISSCNLHRQMLHLKSFSPACIWKYTLESRVYFHIYIHFQCGCMGNQIVTLVAFLWLLSTLCNHMDEDALSHWLHLWDFTPWSCLLWIWNWDLN